MSTYLWAGGTFRETPTSAARARIIDSWRHRRGTTTGLGLHATRFAHGVRTQGVELTAAEWRAIWSDVVAVLRSRGRGGNDLFPRIALLEGEDGEHALALDVRDAPAPRETTALAVFEGSDPRRAPRLKGPDLARYARLRDEMLGEDEDDVILCDADGALLECTTGALVAWCDGALVLSERVDRQLPSVTLFQLHERAIRAGLEVRFEPLRPHDVQDMPLWFVNSLHGISPVSSLRIGARRITPPAAAEAGEWTRWWWSSFAPPADGELDDVAAATPPDLSDLTPKRRSANDDR